MSRDKVHIRDHREVRIPLSNGLISRTPAGRDPIRCARAEITYDIPTGRLGSVTVYGYLTDDRDIERRERRLRSYGQDRARDIVKRQYRVPWDTRQALHTPGWLDELIEKYRPTGGAR